MLQINKGVRPAGPGRQLVRPQQTRELQAMGVILGDLLAAEHNLHWVVYEDGVGRSRALRYKESDFFLFPVTMISRRREVGDLTPVIEIYDKASKIAGTSTPRPTLPIARDFPGVEPID